MEVSLLAPVCIVVRYAGMHSDIYLFHIYHVYQTFFLKILPKN